jgi:hypothetical protein
MTTIILATLSIILMTVTTEAQDLGGAPLPTVIPQDTHDFQAEKAEAGECIGNGDLIYWHWVACGHTVDVTNNEIIRSRINGRLATFGTCGKQWIPQQVRIPGFVWKAVSERNGKPVMLVNASYLNNVKGIRVLDFSLGFFANTQIDFATVDPELANENRTHFRFNNFASRYPQEILVQVYKTNDVVECFYISNPQSDIR